MTRNLLDRDLVSLSLGSSPVTLPLMIDSSSRCGLSEVFGTSMTVVVNYLKSLRSLFNRVVSRRVEEVNK